MKDFLKTSEALEKAGIAFYAVSNEDSADIYVRYNKGIVFIEFTGDDLEFNKIVHYKDGSVYEESNFINRVILGVSIGCSFNHGKEPTVDELITALCFAS